METEESRDLEAEAAELEERERTLRAEREALAAAEAELAAEQERLNREETEHNREFCHESLIYNVSTRSVKKLMENRRPDLLKQWKLNSLSELQTLSKALADTSAALQVVSAAVERSASLGTFWLKSTR